MQTKTIQHTVLIRATTRRVCDVLVNGKNTRNSPSAARIFGKVNGEHSIRNRQGASVFCAPVAKARRTVLTGNRRLL